MKRNDFELGALSVADQLANVSDVPSLSAAAQQRIRELMGASAPAPESEQWRTFGERLNLALEDARAYRPRLFTDGLRAKLQKVCAEGAAQEIAGMRGADLANLIQTGVRPLESESDAGLLTRLMRVTWPEKLLAPDELLSRKELGEFLPVFATCEAARDAILGGLNPHPTVNQLFLTAIATALEIDERYAVSPTARLCRILVEQSRLAPYLEDQEQDDEESFDRPRG